MLLKEKKLKKTICVVAGNQIQFSGSVDLDATSLG